MSDRLIESLRWMSWDEGHNKWSEPAHVFAAGRCAASPALAAQPNLNQLYCAYLDPSDDRIHSASFTTSWKADGVVAPADGSPALAPRNWRLYCVRPVDGRLKATSSTGGGDWGSDVDLGVGLDGNWEGPALAIHGSRLYCAYASTSDGEPPHWWWTAGDDAGWLKVTDSGFTCQGRPALASFRNFLYCVYADLGRATPCCPRHSTTRNLPGGHRKAFLAGAADGLPSLAVRGESLHCVYGVYGDQDRFHWQIRHEGRWLDRPKAIELDVPWTHPPAIAVYDGQLYCLYATSGI